MYCAVIAGGGGTRLWPKSRRRTPKQLLALRGTASLFQQAAERVEPLCSPERLYVVTSQELAPTMRQLLPQTPPDQIIAEPMPRQTALAIGLAAVTIHRRDPGAVLATVGSDHLIADVDGFRRCLKIGLAAAQSGDHLITIGVVPTSPHTGYGYIKVGSELLVIDDTAIYHVDSFKEKPDHETAQYYLQQGGYYWNTNYFVWRVEVLLEAFRRYAPRSYEGLCRIEEVLGTPREAEVSKHVFESLPADPIDTAILERASNILVVPASFDWVDVGNWNDMYIVAEEHDHNHIVGDGTGMVLFEKSEGCLVHRDNRLVAIVGARDLIVVDTEDAVLVLARQRDQDVRHIVDRLRRMGLDQYL